MTLICISNGGPATFVKWRRNDQILTVDGTIYEGIKIILDTIDSTYMNTLYSKNPADLVGTFTCEIHNFRGTDNRSITIDGKILDKLSCILSLS